jgi:alanine racemase
MRFPVSLHVDLDRVRANAAALRARLGSAQVEIYAVVKADAYGLGASRVAEALAPLVDAFYVFDLAEARAADLARFGRRILALDHPWQLHTPAEYRAQRVTPIVYSVARASALRDCAPVLAVDTGMHRFGCPAEDFGAALSAGAITEAMTHASRPEQVDALRTLARGRPLKLHAAATSLLDTPAAWLDAVRPGLGLYRGAVTLRASIVECRDVAGAAGYSRFAATRVGILPLGYSAQIRPGPCLVSGERCQIREVGMQTCFVDVGPNARPGLEVTLLGDGLTEADLATAWGVSEQEVIMRISRGGFFALLSDPSRVMPFST